ncbi:MAG: ABC transporter permease, partial [Clostridium baratii]|nr:ABC transporter permease [Clostridium baratii]
GLIGSVISTFFVFLVYKGFVSWISSKVLYVSLINVSYIGTALLWEFALGGLIVGGVASYAALRKFLIV